MTARTARPPRRSASHWGRSSRLAAVVVAVTAVVATAGTAAAGAPWSLPYSRGDTWNVTCGYGCFWHTGPDAKALDFNWGSSFEADCGRAVLAAATGTVRSSTCTGRLADAGYGCHVEIAHPGSKQSIYAHLKEGSLMRRDAKACRAAIIGRVGRTGSATTCHLHFRTSSGDTPRTPEPMRGSRSRSGGCSDLRDLGPGQLTSCSTWGCDSPQ